MQGVTESLLLFSILETSSPTIFEKLNALDKNI